MKEVEVKKESALELNVGKVGVFLGIIFLVVLALFSLNPLILVSAGQRGVLLEWGKPIAVLGEGIHFRIPVMQSAAILNVRTVKYEVDAASASRDLQDVNTKVALNYHLDPTKTMETFREIGGNENVELAVIAPAIQESVKASTAGYNAEELITLRPAVKQKIEEQLFKRLSDRGIIPETLSITNFAFSPSFTQAIEAKQVAQQQALQAENVLQKVRVEAEQTVASAQGQANATLTKAKAEAQAIQIQGEALKLNTNILTLRYIEKWSGNLPNVVGQNTGLLLNLNMTG